MKSSLRDLEGKPTRTAGAKRRGWRGSGRQDAHDMERHIRMVTDAVMCKLRVRQQSAARLTSCSDLPANVRSPGRPT